MFKWIPLSDDGALLRTLFPLLLLAGLVGWLLYRRFSDEPGKLATTDFILALLWGVLAARIVDYLVFLPSYLGHGNLIRKWTYLGGCFWPGLAAGLSILWMRAKHRQDEPWYPVASGALAVSFAMSIVWIAALLDGSAWGTASDAPWALGSGQYGILVTLVEFGPVAVFDPMIPATYTIHPVQAYFALGCLLIGVAGIFLTRYIPPRTFSAILVGALALLWIGLGYLRADNPAFILSLRAPQIMALGGVIWSIIILSTGRGGGSR